MRTSVGEKRKGNIMYAYKNALRMWGLVLRARVNKNTRRANSGMREVKVLVKPSVSASCRKQQRKYTAAKRAALRHALGLS